MKLLCILLLCSSLSFALNKAYLQSDEFKAYEPEIQTTIKQVIELDEVKTFLEQHPDWTAYAYLEEGSKTDWHVDFYEYDEWVGEAHLNADSGELLDMYLPLELSEEAFAAGKDAIEKLVFRDAEVLAILEDPTDWDSDIYYDIYDQSWTMYLWSGYKSLGIHLYADSGDFSIDGLFDPDALEGEEAKRQQRDTAINIAYSAEGIDTALEGIDGWKTYAESQGGPLWTVEFAANGNNLITVLVDIEAEAVLEARLP